MSSNTASAEMIRKQKYGFWVATKLAPRRAVRWDVGALHEDGRPKFRGRNWVEVLPHGSTRTPERFHAADVELVGPHEWLTYYPGAEEPVCGWGRPRLPLGEMQHCPQNREEGDPFCRKHMAELARSEGEETHDHERSSADAGGE